jgi:hypothetical protein
LAGLHFAAAAAFAYLGVRLRAPIAPARPGKATVVFIVLIWVISLVAFVVDSITYGLVLERANLVATYRSYTAPNPVTHLTEACAVATFVIIVLLTRRHGFKVALLSAFVGAASAPMIFELPFDLIVLNRIYPPIPPTPTIFRLLFFLPLFLVELSTMPFLTFSPLTRLSRYTLFPLAGFFVVFAVWAAFGFSYPSDPLDTAFNDISKVLCFVAAITFFLGDWVALGTKTKETDGARSQRPQGPTEWIALAML